MSHMFCTLAVNGGFVEGLIVTALARLGYEHGFKNSYKMPYCHIIRGVILFERCCRLCLPAKISAICPSRMQTETEPRGQTHTHIHTNTPGHGWLGGCSQCRGKSFAQGRGSGRWQNLYRSARRCTAPGKRRCKLGKNRWAPIHHHLPGQISAPTRGREDGWVF